MSDSLFDLAVIWMAKAMGCPAQIAVAPNDWECPPPKECGKAARGCWRRLLREECLIDGGPGKMDDAAWGRFALDWLAMWLGCPFVAGVGACYGEGCTAEDHDKAQGCWEDFLKRQAQKGEQK